MGHVSKLPPRKRPSHTINSPFGPGSSINLLIPEACGIASTGGCSSATVDSDLQAKVMDFGGGAVDAVWKFGVVRNDAACGVVTAFLDGPAVIYVYILITGILSYLRFICYFGRAGWLP